MNTILNEIDEVSKKKIIEENLFVKNIVVNKDNTKKKVLPYVATEKWIDQLGERLKIN